MDVIYSISQRKKAQGIQTWYLRTSSAGKVTFKSLHTTNKRQAQAKLDELNARKFIPNFAGSGDASMADIFDNWIKHIDFKNGYDSPTTKAYHCRIKPFRTYCEQNKINLYSTLTPMDLERFAQTLKTKSPRTIREIIKVAKLCVAWAIDNYDLPDRDKFRAVKSPKIKQTRHEFWTTEQIEKIMNNAPSDAYRAFWGLMAYAGLRFEEARSLRRENVKNNVITILNGKCGKNAEIPISNRLKTLLEPFLDGEGLVIPRDEIPTRSDRAMVALKVAVYMAKIDGQISHHKLRHSFASELLRRQTNPETVKELMRHSSIDTLFRHYAHIPRTDLATAVETL